MTTPVIGQILDELDARFALITTGNGYFTTMVFKERAMILPYNGSDFPFLNYWPSNDFLIDKQYGLEDRRLSVMIEYHDRTRDRPFTDVAAELAADVWVSCWRTVAAPGVMADAVPGLDGKVSGLFLDQFQPAISETNKPSCAAIITLGITYKVNPGDPFTLVT